jgi:hypothetical protein
MQRILDGSLPIESPEEFEEILDIYTDDPFLYRSYGDLLERLGRHDEAVSMYEEAAVFFIARGLNLQAIVSKILEWSIQKPTHEEGRAFHALLHETGSSETPLQRFWAGMSYAEMVAVMRRMVRVKERSGKTMLRVDQPNNEIFFVVSGFLAEMPSPECVIEARMAGIDIEPKLLGPNDIFGNIFPLDRDSTSDTEIRSVTDVELVKVNRAVLRNAAQKYPNIEKRLRALYKPDSRGVCDRAWQTVRRAMRYGLPTKVGLRCPTIADGQQEIEETGIALDLSIGGICVDLGERTIDHDTPLLKGRLVNLTLDLLNKEAVLNLTGKIVWQRHQPTAQGTSVLIGIRFDTLNPLDQELLIDYCSGSVGEQNLLLSLWDTMVKNE